MNKKRSNNPNSKDSAQASRFDIRKNELKATNALGLPKSVAVIDIEGPIGWDWDKWWDDEAQNTSEDIRKRVSEIDSLDVDEIKVNLIECPGGSVEDGIGIYEALVRHPALVTVEISGYSASIATVIALAGDVRKISSNAMVLSHEAMPFVYGYMNKTELKNTLDLAEILDERITNIYNKHNVDIEALKPYIEADNGNGKWMTAETAKELNLVTEVFEPYAEKGSQNISIDSFKAVAQAFNLPELPDTSNHKPKLAKKETENQKQEADMPLTKEEIQDIATAVARGVVEAQATSAEDAKAKAEKEAEDASTNAVTVEFTGDAENQEDLDAHALKITKAQLKDACNFSDLASVREYQKALKDLDSDGTEATNTKSGTDLSASPVVRSEASTTARDLADNRNFLKNIPK